MSIKFFRQAAAGALIAGAAMVGDGGDISYAGSPVSQEFNGCVMSRFGDRLPGPILNTSFGPRLFETCLNKPEDYTGRIFGQDSSGRIHKVQQFDMSNPGQKAQFDSTLQNAFAQDHQYSQQGVAAAQQAQNQPGTLQQATQTANQVSGAVGSISGVAGQISGAVQNVRNMLNVFGNN